MNISSGFIVEYIRKNGELQKAKLLRSDQKASYKQMKKALVRLLNDDLTEKIDAEGKKVVSLKDLTELTQIGFID